MLDHSLRCILEVALGGSEGQLYAAVSRVLQIDDLFRRESILLNQMQADSLTTEGAQELADIRSEMAALVGHDSGTMPQKVGSGETCSLCGQWLGNGERHGKGYCS